MHIEPTWIMHAAPHSHPNSRCLMSSVSTDAVHFPCRVISCMGEKVSPFFLPITRSLLASYDNRQTSERKATQIYLAMVLRECLQERENQVFIC